MQEINYARQKNSAQSSGQVRCRVCDGPVDYPNLVCSRCWRREREFEKWESYLEEPDSNDAASGSKISSI